MRWYLSAAAIREYQQIAGLPPEEEGPSFDRAERELVDICDFAVCKKPVGEGNRGAAIYQAKATIAGRRVRLELYVSESPRPEGDLPQLVRVRRKGGSRSGKRRTDK